METITFEQLPQLFTVVGKIMSDHSEELCEMDAKMGDGDLGLTMKKGFAALPDIIRQAEETDPGKVLMKSGMKMASVVPSTMGTLMSSGLMSGGKAIAGNPAITPALLAEFLEGFAAGIQKRGKCQPGDRTVLDSILPAAQNATQAASEGGTLQQVAKAALDGAATGLEATKNMEPKFGKAAVFSAKAKGVIDQGAYAGYLLVTGINKFIQG